MSVEVRKNSAFAGSRQPPVSEGPCRHGPEVQSLRDRQVPLKPLGIHGQAVERAQDPHTVLLTVAMRVLTEWASRGRCQEFLMDHWARMC